MSALLRRAARGVASATSVVDVSLARRRVHDADRPRRVHPRPPRHGHVAAAPRGALTVADRRSPRSRVRIAVRSRSTLALRSPGRDGVGDRRQRTGPRAHRRATPNATASATSASSLPTMCPTDVRFSTIWSNPPIRIGKRALHELLRGLARPARTDGGTAVLVVQKHLGADSLQRWLTSRRASPPSASRAGPASAC